MVSLLQQTSVSALQHLGRVHLTLHQTIKSVQVSFKQQQCVLLKAPPKQSMKQTEAKLTAVYWQRVSSHNRNCIGSH
jgi:hypothetical protein